MEYQLRTQYTKWYHSGRIFTVFGLGMFLFGMAGSPFGVPVNRLIKGSVAVSYGSSVVLAQRSSVITPAAKSFDMTFTEDWSYQKDNLV